jgi:phosphopantetheinyl transferase
MPLHSVQHLSPTTVLGLWHLTEAPEALWPLLPPPYRELIPPTAGLVRQGHWLSVRALAHALATQLLGPAADVIVRNDADGRPWLADAPAGVGVSLSHSGEWAAALLSTEGRVGIDIEIVRDKARRLAPMFLSDEEAAHAAAQAEASSSQRYSLLWSAKETLYKLAAQSGIIFKEQLLITDATIAPPRPHSLPMPLQLNAILSLNDQNTRHCICYSEPAPGYVLTYCHDAGPPVAAVS